MIALKKTNIKNNADRGASNTGRIRDMSKLSRQAGVGMIDLLMYMFLVVAAVAFTFWLKSAVWGPFLGWMEATAVSNQMGKIENVYSGAANYTGLTTASMAVPTIYPTKYLPGAGAIINRFGGNVTLGIATVNTTSDTLQYTSGGVRADSCFTLVNQLAEDADRITVGGTVVKPLNTIIDAGKLQTQCNSGNTVNVMFERIKRA